MRPSIPVTDIHVFLPNIIIIEKEAFPFPLPCSKYLLDFMGYQGHYNRVTTPFSFPQSLSQGRIVGMLDISYSLPQSLSQGRFVGYPGHYNKMLGIRNEDCGPGGCFIELAQQLGVILIGKQARHSIKETFNLLYREIFSVTVNIGNYLSLSYLQMQLRT